VSVWSHNPEPGPETRQTIVNPVSAAAAFILMPYVTICELEAHIALSQAGHGGITEPQAA